MAGIPAYSEAPRSQDGVRYKCFLLNRVWKRNMKCVFRHGPTFISFSLVLPTPCKDLKIYKMADIFLCYYVWHVNLILIITLSG